ncbi:MAG: hypothetical protein FGM15_12710 [Chthoniobacterales bacterium]|nr:hypothetical protein [Chthoniobacterales bacterium]
MTAAEFFALGRDGETAHGEEARAQIALYEAERAVLIRERDQWRECAESLAFAVRLESKQTQMNWRAFAQDGLAAFDRLKEASK